MATEKQSEASEATRPTVAKEFVFDDDDHYYVDLRFGKYYLIDAVYWILILTVLFSMLMMER